MSARPTRETCPTCGGGDLAQILHWPAIPVNAALFPTTLEESLAIPRGSFRLVACPMCGFLFNADHDECLVEYSPRCVETQACSPSHREFTAYLARRWVESHDLRGAPLVEVGCGPEASFLREMCALTGSRGVGVDPACTAGEDGTVTLLPERFGEEHATLPGAALVCRHTLEHIPDVAQFLAAVRTWAARHPDAPLLFEVPDSGRILREGAFWDVYYEHCSYFTSETLQAAFRTAGLRPERTTLEFDGQYLVLEARLGPGGSGQEPNGTAGDTVEAARTFARTVEARIDSAATRLRRLAGEGPLVVWQAGGKALSLLTLTGVGNAVTALVDGNPAKRGLYLPGTDLVIRGPEDVASLAPRHVVVMNAVYVDEIGASLRALGVGANVFPLEALFDREAPGY